MVSKGTEVVPYNNYALALQEDIGGFLDVMRENVGTGALTAFDLERVKFPTAGGVAWTIPTLSGEPDIVRNLDGIVVYHREPRAYWQTPFGGSGGGVPPDCASEHGDVGVGTPGGPCAQCPFAEFGSARDEHGNAKRGQACKQMKLLLLLTPDALLPLALFLPPTSMVPVRRYLLQLASRGKHYASVVTRLSLDKTKNNDAIEYSIVRPTMLDDLAPDQVTKVRAYADALRATFETITLTAEDVPEGE